MELTFEFAGDVVVVKIKGHDVTFATSITNFQTFVPIESIKLSEQEILKEHPDLKDLEFGEMRKEAIERFKTYLKKLDGENLIKDYVVLELEQQGYILKMIRREGFRPIKVR